MAADDQKRPAVMIALGIPKPGSRPTGDEGGGEDAKTDEAEDAAGGGPDALASMFRKLQRGDSSGAYASFEEAVRLCVADQKMDDMSGDDGEKKSEDYGSSGSD